MSQSILEVCSFFKWSSGEESGSAVLKSISERSFSVWAFHNFYQSHGFVIIGRRPDSDQSPNSRNELAWQIVRNCRFRLALLTFFLPFCLYWLSLLFKSYFLSYCGTGIITLSLIVMGCSVAGRLLCLLYTDKVGLKQVWVSCTACTDRASFMSGIVGA